MDEASFIKHISRFDEWGESLEVKERLLSRRLAFTVQKYRVVNLGEHVQLREGGWFLARPSVLLPSEASAMWFGKVEAIFQHKGPDSEERLMLQVTWYLTGPLHRALHPELRTPIVGASAPVAYRGQMWPAAWAVPWLCWASPLEGDPTKLAIIARHWGILRPLGLPSPPASQPLPLVLRVASIASDL